MLSFDDLPTIRFAMMRRLDKENGITIVDLKMKPFRNERPAYIGVSIEALIDHSFTVVSGFHLPGQWDLKHLHNEIDEIAEQWKSARLDRFFNGDVENGRLRTLPGTGMRGRWAQHA